MILEQSLSQRKQVIEDVIKILQSTKVIFDKYGKEVFVTAYDRFQELESSLTSDQIRMVVIGEFSRGKSSLLNALLNMSQLPTAQQATTSINAFIYPVPKGESDEYIEVSYFDTEEKKKIPMDSSHVIAQWGTELDADNADSRKNIERISIYMKHKLLDLGLVLIDTPGLESIHQHHEEITRRAIDGAHVAIWVQSADQLGGNKREWQFLQSSIHKKFHKFITVVNKWDMVIACADDYDARLPLEKREADKLKVVKDNFREHLTHINADDLELFLEKNLFGVSATWALKGTPEQRNMSGLDKLTQRIQEMCTGEEAMQATIFTPLRSLMELQATLKEHINDNLTAVQDTTSIEEREREIEKIEADIKHIAMAQKNASLEARAMHDRMCKTRIERVHDRIVVPLESLKQYVSSNISKDYVRGEIKKHAKSIDLPPHVAKEYKDTLEKVNKCWVEQAQETMSDLEDARSEYAASMNKHAISIRNSLVTDDICLPELHVECAVDLHSIQEHIYEQEKIEQEIAKNEEEILKYDKIIAENYASEATLQAAQSSLNMLQRRHEALGTRPKPIEITKHRNVRGVVGTLLLGEKLKQYNEYDHSNVQAWQEERAEIIQKIDKKMSSVEDIQREHEKKTGRRMSAEMAQRKLEQQNARHLAKQEALAVQRSEALARAVDVAYEHLCNSTVGGLERNISLLKTSVAKSIEATFQHQLQYLSQCVDEQYLEPLRAKKQSREEAQKTIEHGKREIEEKVQEYSLVLQEIEELTLKSSKLLP